MAVESDKQCSQVSSAFQFRIQLQGFTFSIIVSAPVVVTSQSYEPSNRAPHQVQLHTSVAPTNYLPTSQPPPLPSNVPPTTINMPMPMPVHQNTFHPPYPPTNAPYPSNSTPFSINTSAPYPDGNLPPPTYNQVVQENKQPAFNPSFNGWLRSLTIKRCDAHQHKFFTRCCFLTINPCFALNLQNPHVCKLQDCKLGCERLIEPDVILGDSV